MLFWRGGDSPAQAATVVGYETSELESVPQASILGVGCGAPVKFADLQKGETVVDLGSGGGIDVFLSANKVSNTGKVIGIDMTDEMLERARRNTKEGGYTNVEFRKGDIEKRIPVDENSVDVVISNCVINLTMDKVNAFKEIYRILKQAGENGHFRLGYRHGNCSYRCRRGEMVWLHRWCAHRGALSRQHQTGRLSRCRSSKRAALHGETTTIINWMARGRRESLV